MTLTSVRDLERSGASAVGTALWVESNYVDVQNYPFIGLMVRGGLMGLKGEPYERGKTKDVDAGSSRVQCGPNQPGTKLIGTGSARRFLALDRRASGRYPRA